jgi:hypothetical protein
MYRAPKLRNGLPIGWGAASPGPAPTAGTDPRIAKMFAFMSETDSNQFDASPSSPAFDRQQLPLLSVLP